MNKKALMIVAHETFRDEEYLEPKKILEENGISVTTASSETGTAVGKFGTEVTIDTTINDIDINPYQVIIYIGGAGSKNYWNNPTAHSIAQQALLENKILASICSASVILARAGVLKGRKATSFPGDSREMLKEGVNYIAEPVVQDGLIITANGPEAAVSFGVAIAKLLEEVG
jgi:protease I